MLAGFINGKRALRAIGAGVIVAASTYVALALFRLTWLEPVDAVARGAASFLYRFVPNGRAFSGSGPWPAWPRFAEVITATHPDAGRLQNTPAFLNAFASRWWLSYVFAHLCVVSAIVLIWKNGAFPRYLRMQPSSPPAIRGPFLPIGRVAWVSSLLCVAWIALARFSHLVWSNFQNVHLAHTTTEGYAVSLGPFGVGGIWAGAVAAHCWVVWHVTRRTLERVA